MFRSALYQKLEKDGVRVRFWGIGLQHIEFQRAVNQDMRYVLFSLMFVCLWIVIHSRSPFFGIMGCVQIMLSMSFAFFWFRVVGQIYYFTQLHMCVIFLACGVGADDIFVFNDAYHEAKREIYFVTMGEQQFMAPPRLLTKREHKIALVKALHRSYKAVFNTSFTTCAAFFATAMSPIMPISGFGIYAATVILTNYFFTMVNVPALLYLADTAFEPGAGCCCGGRLLPKGGRCLCHPCCYCCGFWARGDCRCICWPRWGPHEQNRRDLRTGVAVVVGPPQLLLPPNLGGDNRSNDKTPLPMLQALEQEDASKKTISSVNGSSAAGDVPPASRDIEMAEASGGGAPGGNVDKNGDNNTLSTVGGVTRTNDPNESESITVFVRYFYFLTRRRLLIAKSGATPKIKFVTVDVAQTKRQILHQQNSQMALRKRRGISPTPTANGVLAANGTASNGGVSSSPTSPIFATADPELTVDDEAFEFDEKHYHTVFVVPVFFLVSLLVFGIYGTYHAGQLTPPVEEEMWFQSGHMYNGFRAAANEKFQGATVDEYVEVTLTWGLEGIDRSCFDRWEPSGCRGAPIYRNNLDLYSAVPALEAACQKLRTELCDLEGCSPPVLTGAKKLGVGGTVVCFIEEFLRNQTTTSSSFTTKFPTNPQFHSSLRLFRNGTKPGENALPDIEPQHSERSWFPKFLGYVGSELKFVSISHRSTLKFFLPHEVRKGVYNKYEDLAKQLTIPGLGKPFQTTVVDWTWFDIERTLILTLFQGFIICVPLSYMVCCNKVKLFPWKVSMIHANPP